MLFLLLFTMFAQHSSAQCPTPLPGTLFTIDGNPCDWSGITNGPSSAKIIDPYGNGVVDNQFQDGKDFYLAADLMWTMGQTKQKGDIANSLAYYDANTNRLYFAGDRTSNEGAAEIGFWFFKNGTDHVGTT